MDPFERGFIAGVVVTSGSWTGDGRVGWLSIKTHADDSEPLMLLHRLLGGTLYGPYDHGGRRYYDWRLRGRALADALPHFDAILPTCRKRDQYLAWKARYAPAADASRHA